MLKSDDVTVTVTRRSSNLCRNGALEGGKERLASILIAVNIVHFSWILLFFRRLTVGFRPWIVNSECSDPNEYKLDGHTAGSKSFNLRVFVFAGLFFDRQTVSKDSFKGRRVSRPFMCSGGDGITSSLISHLNRSRLFTRRTKPLRHSSKLSCPPKKTAPVWEFY